MIENLNTLNVTNSQTNTDAESNALIELRDKKSALGVTVLKNAVDLAKDLIEKSKSSSIIEQQTKSLKMLVDDFIPVIQNMTRFSSRLDEIALVIIDLKLYEESLNTDISHLTRLDKLVNDLKTV